MENVFLSLPKLLRERKRDRPSSAYFESPEPTDSPGRRPFRNISNFVSSHTKSISKLVSHAAHEFDRFFRQASLDDEGDTTLNDEEIEKELLSDETDADPLDSPTHHKRSMVLLYQPQPPAPTIRRIHSMCQTSKEKETHPFDDNSHLAKLQVPFFKVDNDITPRINHDTMYQLLCGTYAADFDDVVVVDCRFAYEFNGGHIHNALNISSQKHLESYFIHHRSLLKNHGRRLVIFHCEFSIFRGPTMAQHLRKCDRILNKDNYPMLSYPDIVVLEGGYKLFYDHHKRLCSPQGYIEMKDASYEKHCEFELDKIRLESKLTRARSYNFNNSSSRLLEHHRLSSYTTVTSHAQNLKVLKRQRLSSRVDLPARYTRLLTFLGTSLHSIFNSPGAKFASASSFFDGPPSPDLVPPPVFRLLSLVSRLLVLVNSSLLSILSDALSAFSSSESLDCYSGDSDLWEFKPAHTKSYSLSLLHPVRKPTCPVPQMPLHVKSKSSPFNTLTKSPFAPTPGSFKFPSQPPKPQLSRVNTKPPLICSSPVVSSPLSTATPISTVESSVGNSTLLLIDPINDTPVDFSVPMGTSVSVSSVSGTPLGNCGLTKIYRHARRRSNSTLGSNGGYSFSLDFDQVEEEEE